MAKKNRNISTIAHTFDADPTDATVVAVYKTMATRIRDDQNGFAKKFLAAYKPQDRSDPINLRELDFFLDCGVWPEHYVLQKYVRTYGTEAELRKAAADYLGQGQGPG